METGSSVWLTPPSNLHLAADEVHVWRAELDLPPTQLRRLKSTLTPDESERADRFRFEKDHQHYIAARGILRTILSSYLCISPERLRFVYSDYAKPSLAPEFAHHDIQFNLSHSAGLALYAVTYRYDVGIDVEHIRTNFEHEEIAQRFFSPREVAILNTVSPHLKPLAFFNCWTRKEAYIKAQGQGLSLPLDRFDVSFAPGEPAQLLLSLDNPQEIGEWSLLALTPGHDYAGALAVRHRGFTTQSWQWTYNDVYLG